MTEYRKTKLEAILMEQFAPIYLQVINESHMHKVPVNAETHFKIVMVSDSFENLSSVQRHKLVYKALALEMTQGLHAISLHTLSPKQWQDSSAIPDSPLCSRRQQNS
jgi:BolA protein